MPFLPELLTRDLGVVILGHGSRAAEARQLLGWVEEQLASRLSCDVVCASLQFNSPTLEEASSELAGRGVRQIIVAPYFLFEGNHLKQDIPEEIERLGGLLPQVEFILADSLGADARLVELLKDRVVAAGGQPQNGGSVKPAASQPRLAQHPIEKESFDIIDELLAPRDRDDPQYQIVRRVVHTTGDTALAAALLFSDDAVAAGLAALRQGANIYCDVNMVAAGIEPTARQRGLEVSCSVADPRTAELAAQWGLTRGAAGFRRLAGSAGAAGLAGSVVAIGNAPTALFEVLRLAAEEGVRPALVVGIPVGFVGARESKEALAESGLPFITLPGNRGGSSMAVAIVNALMRMM